MFFLNLVVFEACAGLDRFGWVAGVESSSPQTNGQAALFSLASQTHRLCNVCMEKPRGRHRKNYNDPGHAHELTFSSYKHFPFLKSERTCGWLAIAIETARTEWNLDLWAYVFMPDHVHLIIHPRNTLYDITTIRKSIKAPVALKAIAYLEQNASEWIPRITRQRNQKTERLFWQSGGGYDRNIVEPATLLKMIDYLHLNPVRRGLVTSAEQWKWSSAGWFAGATECEIKPDPIPPEWVD